MDPQKEKPRITAEMTLPEVIQQYPATRAVFDRYGLQGCGGPTGPYETIEWFARMHGVDLSQLLQELNSVAICEPTTPSYRPTLADRIYRPFFTGGILTVLTLGCVWGAINLLLMGRKGDFGAVDYSWVLAHGHAMVFGFLGFFIMGFAYQAIPRLKHTHLPKPSVALASLPLMAGGLLFQTLGHLYSPRPGYLPLGLIGGFLQILSVLLFCHIMYLAIKYSGKPEPFDAFIYVGSGWFLIASLLNPVIFYLFENAPSYESFLFRVATFNIPYRDIQLLGIAVVFILGVSLRFLPHAYGLREPSPRWRNFLLWGVNSAIILAIASFLARRFTGNPWWMLINWLSSWVLFIAALGSPFQYGLFRQTQHSDRSLKFIRAGYLWFIIAMAMLVLVPVYNLGIYMPITGSRIPFSHAFFGAYRHALTVGFLTLMIVGVSSKVVPTLSGLEIKRTPSLWPSFLLLNVGNLARVTTEIATDFTRSAYAWMGWTGFIEVAGLLLWAWELYRNTRAGDALIQQALLSPPQPSSTVTEISPEVKVGDILSAYPETLDIFLKYGFTPLKHEWARKTLAKRVSLEQAAQFEKISLEDLLRDLRRIIRQKG